MVTGGGREAARAESRDAERVEHEQVGVHRQDGIGLPPHELHCLHRLEPHRIGTNSKPPARAFSMVPYSAKESLFELGSGSGYFARIASSSSTLLTSIRTTNTSCPCSTK